MSQQLFYFGQIAHKCQSVWTFCISFQPNSKSVQIFSNEALVSFNKHWTQPSKIESQISNAGIAQGNPSGKRNFAARSSGRRAHAVSAHANQAEPKRVIPHQQREPSHRSQ